MECPACGAKNRDDAAFCLSCRATMPASADATPTIGSGAASVTPTTPPSPDPAWSTAYYDRDPAAHLDSPPSFAGFWERFLALFLDNTFAFLLAIPPALALFLLGVWLASNQQAAPVTRGQRAPIHDGFGLTFTFAVICVFLLVAFAYHVIMTARGGGWGMRIMGIKIVRVDNGGPPGYGRAFGRVITRSVLSLVPIAGGLVQVLDNLWMIWDGKKQTWHDKAAGTFVVRR